MFNPADAPSRQQLDHQLEWSISQDVFQQLDHQWEQYSMDLHGRHEPMSDELSHYVPMPSMEHDIGYIAEVANRSGQDVYPDYTELDGNNLRTN
ncbi:hypothetical protein INT47_011418 [Mucor saturninus]|uniref:Uncharacterized protein n=1 Tax=Mucor saturninus TaxID=64648 RepID=A0A8H7QFQ9_9FUNG|nr:hypothetical protein INT47_011418 [Mucor saturninus]